MPSLKMKSQFGVPSLRENHGLHVRSSMISKSHPHVKLLLPAAKFDTCIQNIQDDSLSTEVHTRDAESNRGIDQQDFTDGQNTWFQKQPSTLDPPTVGKEDSVAASISDLESIFSPSREPNDLHSVLTNDHEYFDLPGLGADESEDNRRSFDYQSCNVSDFFICDMIVAGLPLSGNSHDADIIEANSFHDYSFAQPNIFFDVADEYMILPSLEETARINVSDDIESYGVSMMEPDNSNFFLTTIHTRSCNVESEIDSNLEQVDEFDPQLFIKNLPDLSDVSSLHPVISPKETWKRKPITLVLDLDETLVHSALEHCDDADFSFMVFFNMKEHTVYVKKRPHLHTFLQRVAEMFEIVIFTASQSIYAEQLLDILDPEKNLISKRVYRESCIFTDGTYTKDLTVLGIDLSKVVIIDNTPQVFRLQINNGIPIKSWFDDPSDCALLSLLPFLESLVNADDVRPIIANKFGNRE